VLSQGPTRASVVLKSGLQVDLRVVDEASYGAALCYFTGSKTHNITLRRLAQERGFKLNEYGVFRGRERIAGADETPVYAALGLPFIAPELREDRGEIAAARAGRLPQLVDLADLRGDLHVHTTATDGHHTLAQMALAAKVLGLSYLAITEHSRRLAMAHGLDPRRLAEQCDAIDRLNQNLEGIVLLKGIEVDVLEDGSLDLPDASLARLDLVIGAVHSRFDLPRARQTERILRAMDNPCFTLLAHPTGRVIDSRAPYDVDMLRVIRHARRRGCFLELNAHPERLDLLDSHCIMAKEEGVLVAINSDAHSRELKPFDRSQDVDAARRHSELVHSARLHEVGDGNAVRVQGRTERLQSRNDTPSVGLHRIDPQVEILGESRPRMEGHGIPADDQESDFMVAECGQQISVVAVRHHRAHP